MIRLRPPPLCREESYSQESQGLPQCSPWKPLQLQNLSLPELSQHAPPVSASGSPWPPGSSLNKATAAGAGGTSAMISRQSSLKSGHLLPHRSASARLLQMSLMPQPQMPQTPINQAAANGAAKGALQGASQNLSEILLLNYDDDAGGGGGRLSGSDYQLPGSPSMRSSSSSLRLSHHVSLDHNGGTETASLRAMMEALGTRRDSSHPGSCRSSSRSFSGPQGLLGPRSSNGLEVRLRERRVARKLGHVGGPALITVMPF